MDPSVSRPGIFERIEPDMLPAPGLLKAANFLTGQTIFAEGEFGDRLYVIDSGKVKISQRVGAGRKHLQAVLEHHLH